ncbi:NlpC/P60 family protein [Arthrobacter sp. CP30]
MTSRTTIARHRSEAQTTAGFSALAAAVTTNAGGIGRQAAVIVAASGLVLTSGVAANAADLQPQREVATSNVSVSSVRAAVVASNSSVVSFNMTPVKVKAKPVVKTPKAPVVVAPVVEEVAVPVVETAPVVEAAPVAAAAPAAPAVAAPAAVAQAPQAAAVAAPAVAPAPVAAPAPAPVTAPAPAPAVSSGVAATIAEAAKGQLGVMQDCTRLASNALAAAGINFHGWPAGYLSLGRTVSAGEAIPGDLIYYADGGMGMAHIAVYIGGGQAVHGGFNGNTTVIAPAELGSGGVYIRVGG